MYFSNLLQNLMFDLGQVDPALGLITATGGSTTTFTVDSTTKIGEVQTAYDDLKATYDANAKAHEEATARIVFGFIQQKVTADGVQDGEIKFLADIGVAWGIYDKKTADVLASVDDALTEHGLNSGLVLAALNQRIADLPNEKLINIEVRTSYTMFGAEPGGGAPVIITPGNEGQTGGR